MASIWYFAYGSNINAQVLRGRRGIEFQRALPAQLEGWQLVFDKPPLIDIGESFANLVPDAAAVALGVLYEVSADDLPHIELTEGVPIGNYRRIEVEVTPLAAGSALPAHTLVSENRDPSLCPSHRYMELVVDGALSHGLPAEHIAFLRSVPSRPSTAAALEFQARVQEMMKQASASRGRGS